MLTKILTLVLLTRAVQGHILDDEANYQKPKLERNNILNKGVWVKNKQKDSLFEKTRTADFIFRANSMDVENLLQNNFDAFGTNYMEDSPSVSNYVKRTKRAIRRIREHRLRKNLKNCIGTECETFITEEQNKLRKDPVKRDDKGRRVASAFNDYPYEVAILLNNKETQKYTPENYTNTVHDDGTMNKNLSKTINIQKSELSIETDFKENNDSVPKNITSTRRSTKYDYESEIIKKIEITEDINRTRDNNELNDIKVIDRNIFNKDNTVWHQNAPIPNMNVYKVVPKEPQKSKPVTERGLIKVISMLTKTFKKIMKQHNEIKGIHEQINDVKDQFMKNAEVITKKLQDFDVKYSYLLKFHEKLKMFDTKLASKQEYFKNKEREMANNFREFESQQNKFLQQQRQFYNIQKLMLAQNEKINTKQNAIAKTQSEISHRQNNFARILKKAKQLYLESKNPTTKLSSNLIKPVHTPKPVVPNAPITPTTPSTESVKINLFSIPTSNKIENQDDLIIKDKDEQNIDDLVYKYYFNNTFIDNIMKNNVLTSLMSMPNNPVIPRNVKNKRNELETTILLPIYENDSETVVSKNRERRWINHHSRHRSRRRERGKGHAANIINATDGKVIRNKVVNNIPIAEEPTNVKDGGETKVKDDPFLTMATSFCKAIHQDLNAQMLRWCVEKALRRLQFLDMKNFPMADITTTTETLKLWDSKKPQQNTPLKTLITKLYNKPNTVSYQDPTTVITAPSIVTTEAPKTTVPEMTVTVTDIPTTQSTTTLASTTLAAVTQAETVTEAVETTAFFPDNEELESNLRQYDIKPDVEGNVYFEGSVHASDIIDSDSQGMDDIMPGLESNSRIDMDPLAFDLQARRRAIVRKLNEKIKMSLG